LASVLWAFSFGLGAPLASLWLQDAGYGPTVIGLNTGVYYLGIVLAAGFIPRLMHRWGRTALIVGMLASGVTVAWFPWGGSLAGWFVLRILNGFASALSLIPLETLVNRTSPDEQRARNFGIYAFSIALGIALGELVGMPMYPVVPRLAFLLGGFTALLAGMVVRAWLTWPALAEEPRHGRTSLAFDRNILSFGGAWSQGFLEGSMMALMPIYLLAIGLSDQGAGWLMGGIIIGVILFQVPVAWLADRFGRTAVLLGCYGVTGAALAALQGGISWPGLAVCLFLAGACSGAFYPLGLALLGERLPSASLGRANAWYLAINSLGSVVGPVLAGNAMEQFGHAAMFAVGNAAVLGVIAIWALLRLYEWFAVAGPAPEGLPQVSTENRSAA
jgi:MFS family permease